MPVITIRGQYGSWSAEIGELIAHKLNIDYVDREIIAEVAERLRRPSDKHRRKGDAAQHAPGTHRRSHGTDLLSG